MKISYKKLTALIIILAGISFLSYYIYHKFKTPANIKFVKERNDEQFAQVKEQEIRYPDDQDYSENLEKEAVKEIKNKENVSGYENKEESVSKNETKAASIQLPSKVVNPAPFIPQAPYKIWDDLHNEACEEASLITIYYYLQGEKKVSAKAAEAQIQALIEYENENYNGRQDIDAKEIKEIAKNHYSFDLEIITQYDLNSIKNYLADKRVILIPVAGRLLNNPNFKNPGPLYHTLTIVGYDDGKKEFITQEPGTRKGENYRYSYEVILDAIHDYPGDKERILEGRKVLLVSPVPEK